MSVDVHKIQIPTPKYKPGDYVWYVRDHESVFKRAYVCGWKIVIWSHDHSLIYYTVEYDDPEVDYDEDPSGGCDYDIAENRLYDNELDALRKQLELWGSEHTRQQSTLESLDRIRANIMKRILELESKETTNAKHS